MIILLYSTGGEEKYILDTLSCMCYISQTFSISAFAFFSRIQNLWLVITKSSPKIPQPFDMDFIRNRVKLIQNKALKMKLQNPLTIGRFIIFLTLPVITAIIGLVFKFKMLSFDCFAPLPVLDIFISFSFINYGCFWFVVYVQRISLQHQLNDTLTELNQLAKTDARTTARRLIDHTYSEYHLIRKITGLWMEMTLLTVTILGLCTVTFSYDNAEAIDSVKDPGEKEKIGNFWAGFTVIMWMQNLMFCVIPFSALGGINLEYLWHRFRHVIIRSRNDEHESFWLVVEQYVNHIDTLGRLDLKLTAIFPLIGVLVYNVTVQHDNSFRFWGSRFYCNVISNHTIFYTPYDSLGVDL